MTVVARDKPNRRTLAAAIAALPGRIWSARPGFLGGARAATVAPEPILTPYRADPDSKAARRRRRIVITALTAFCLFYGMVWAFIAPYLLLAMMVPVAVMAALVVWTLPESRTAPTRALTGLFFAYFVCLIMWPNYLALALPGLPWITMARLTGFPLTLILLICVSISVEFRSRVAAVLKTSPLVWKLFAVFLVLQGVSLAFSHSPFYSLDRYFIWQTGFTAVFFVSCYVFAAPGRAELMAKMLWIMALLVGALALWEKRMEHVPWAGHIPSVLQVSGERIQMILAGQRRSGDGIYRAQATFSTSLGLAEYLAYSMPFAIHFASMGARARDRWIAGLSIPFLLFVVLITGSRLGMIGCLASFLIYTLLWSVQRWKTERESIVGPAITLGYPAVAAVVLGATLFIGRIRTVVWGNGAMESSNLGRHIQWAMGIPKIKSHPWGYGVGMGGETLGYRDLGGLLTIDSYYLVVFLEYGVIGFLFYFMIFLTTIFYGYKTYISSGLRDKEISLLMPMIIVIANFVLIKSVFAQDDIHPMIAMIMGMIVATVWRAKQKSSEIKPPPERSFGRLANVKIG